MPSKTKKRNAGSQALIKRASQRAVARSKALEKIGLLEKGHYKKVAAKTKITGAQRYARSRINKIATQDKNVNLLGWLLKTDQLTPLDKENRIKAKRVSKEVAEKLKGDHVVIKTGKDAYSVILTQKESVDKKGRVVTRIGKARLRSEPIYAEDIEEDEEGDSPLRDRIEKAYSKARRNGESTRLSYVWKEYEGNITRVNKFDSATAMYTYLVNNYTPEQMSSLGGITILDYQTTLEVQKGNNTFVRLNPVKSYIPGKGKRTARKDMSPEQLETARVRDRRLYKIKRNRTLKARK